MRQIIRNRPLSPGRGLLAVLGLVAAVLLDSVAFQLLTPLLGEGPASLLFWAIGALVALWAMRRYVMAYAYELNGVQLKVTHLYGRYQRPMEEIYRNAIVATGSVDEMRKRYPKARITRAVRPGCDLEPFAVAHRRDDRTRLLILQPDAELRDALTKIGRKR